ncbi:hypothetical protein Hanom_Chr14g01317401 [Helianthus anomalus]
MRKFLERWPNLVLPIGPEYMDLAHSQLVRYLHHSHPNPGMKKTRGCFMRG